MTRDQLAAVVRRGVDVVRLARDPRLDAMLRELRAGRTSPEELVAQVSTLAREVLR